MSTGSKQGSPLRLLIVDDEPDLRTLYELTLLGEGYELETAGSVADALARLKARRFEALITDMRLPDGSGLDLLMWLEQQGRSEKTLVITAYGSAENAVEALKAGAYDYLTKPVDLRQFRQVVASALGRIPQTVPTVVPAQLPRQESTQFPPKAGSASVNDSLPSQCPPAAQRLQAQVPASALARLAGTSAAIQQVRTLIEKVARSMAPVLLQGESGTGKELVARAIHDGGARARQRFVAVNCGAIPEQLLEAEFFGYRKGAFTGANEDREGFFQAADGGTLFLDEIGDLPLAMQSKLLRSIQERTVRPIGAVVETPVNVRILSATHKDLGTEAAAGRFRQDLFYRLNVIQLRVPPLRERIEDVSAIAEQVLERIAHDAGVAPVPRLTAAAVVHLSRYAFPGNVRELENLLHRALALSGGEWLDVSDLAFPEDLLGDSQFGALLEPHEGNELVPDLLQSGAQGLARQGLPRLPAVGVGARPTEMGLAELPSDIAAFLDEVERQILLQALARFRFNRTAAGASLGLSLRQMRYRMARLNVTAGEPGNAD
jgi:two-component system response regulator PilR (NtrC family)